MDSKGIQRLWVPLERHLETPSFYGCVNSSEEELNEKVKAGLSMEPWLAFSDSLAHLWALNYGYFDAI